MRLVKIDREKEKIISTIKIRPKFDYQTHTCIHRGYTQRPDPRKKILSKCNLKFKHYFTGKIFFFIYIYKYLPIEKKVIFLCLSILGSSIETNGNHN